MRRQLFPTLFYDSVAALNSCKTLDRINCLYCLRDTCVHHWQRHVHTGVWMNPGFIYVHVGP